jgi:hypothetical protein
LGNTEKRDGNKRPICFTQSAGEPVLPASLVLLQSELENRAIDVTPMTVPD